jgi:restriction endonuclease Mrr
MAIPDFQSIMLPLLRFCGDGQEHSNRDAIEALSGELGLTPEEQKQLLPSGQQRVFDNRVAWARAYMKMALLVENTRRGVFRITPRGQQVLVKMGYGGSIKDAGEAVGRSGDEGIDGIIKEDRLGLDIIYIQAKKWENTVSRPEIQKFSGALQGKRARKGIFITTSDFSKSANEYVAAIESKIILIDGRQFVSFMIDFGVGVAIEGVYELKRLDTDYFEES